MKDQDGKPQYPQFTVALRIRPINEAELDEEAAIIAHKVGEQIYNEIIRDLLNPSSGVLELREDSKGTIQIAGVTEFSTRNAEEIMQLLRKGNKQRTEEPTAANKTSSRSHAVVEVTVKQKSRVKSISAEVRVGRLFMIDLAGSERASQTQTHGKRMKEGAHINRSLLALGNCITALSEKGGNRSHHVNFRDSKLTRLLKDSLSGNSRAVMIAHISPAGSSFEESRATLIYAYRAKNIKTRVKRNLHNVSYHIAQYSSSIADLRREIERLEEKVEQQEKEKSTSRPDIRGVPAEVQEKSSSYSRQEMNNLRDQLVGAFTEQMEMRQSLVELENTNIELHIDTSRHLLTIADWERDKARCAKKPRQKAMSDRGDEDGGMDTADEEEDMDTPEPHEVVVAREEVHMLVAEQRKTAALKAELEHRLANTKVKALQLQHLLPKQISTEDQREVLSLLCKVHELEVGNTELQAKALCKENLLCQKDFVILRYQQHMSLCEEVIRQQRTLIADYKIQVPEQLDKLYQVCFQEMEGGSLNRQLQFHSHLSSALRNDCVLKLGESLLHLDLDHFEKAVSDNRKGVLSRARFELPPIIFESDSDSKTSMSSPALIQTRQNSSVGLTALHRFRTRTRQKQDDPSTEKFIPTLLSPNTLGTERRHSISLPQLSPQVLEEIAVGTKSISLVAARRRSRVIGPESSFFVDKGNSITSLQLLERDVTRPRDLQPIYISRQHMKKAMSIENLPTQARRKAPKLNKELMNEGLMERKSRQERSHSLEAYTQELPKVKPQNVYSRSPDRIYYLKGAHTVLHITPRYA
ncbi:kinesin-like protein KIF19 isoform X3 [Ascaphus truei]|uniref:kinesin-like protein KIF19 isoform X3 n=1 Tax=Ascaphus truei TaxID=8439 RepID=UPI003F59FC87